MANPDLIPVPFAQDGDKNPIPLERIISDPSYRATWLEGFPPDTRIPEEVGGEAPDGLDFNGVLNILSQAVVFLQKGNAYQFDAALAPYPIGALVRSNDNLTTYQSTVSNNGNNPNSNMSGWRVYNGSGFVVDNLTTDDAGKPVSAKQAKILQDTKFKSNGSMPISSDFPAWDAKSGIYTKSNAARQQTVIHFLGGGSVPAVQFLVDYSNGGISYRSARDTLGFEKPFEKLVTELSGKAIAAAAADTAEKLKNPRSINGVEFDGSSNISLPMLGRGQSHASTSKVGNTNYVNSGSAPIFEKLIVRGGGAQINVWIGGNRVTGSTAIPLNQIVFIDFIVPPGQTYAVTTNSNQILEWSSLS